MDDNFNIHPSCPALDEINKWLEKEDKGVLSELSPHMITDGKAAQSYVYGGAYNYLDVKPFITYVYSRNWKHPDSVRLFVHDENDDAYNVASRESGG